MKWILFSIIFVWLIYLTWAMSAIGDAVKTMLDWMKSHLKNHL